ncbi:MAG: MFS transporter [Oscillospiraceae bacterium]
MQTDRLFHKNFTLVIIGQIISILGNTILSFALPLHLLTLTGSATIFGTVMAISIIPTILLSPIGGMISDRVNRRNIMVILDFVTCAIILLIGCFISNMAVLSICVGQILLSIIRSFYQPAVQACVPSITSPKNLLKANSLVNMIGSVSMLVGPVVGGFLYGFFGIIPIIIISCIAFFISAVMELFIQLPFIKQSTEHNILATVKKDFRDSIHFIIKENPAIAQTIGFSALLNMILSSLLNIGIPYIINIKLELSSELYGIAQSAMGIGGLLGGLLVGVLATKINSKNVNVIILSSILSVLPIGISLLLALGQMPSFWIIAISTLLTMLFATMISIIAITYVQRVTPTEMTGKIMSFVMTVCMCAMPIGQAIYGFLFETIADVHWIIFSAIAIMVVITILFRNSWSELITGSNHEVNPTLVDSELAQYIN